MGRDRVWGLKVWLWEVWEIRDSRLGGLGVLACDQGKLLGPPQQTGLRWCSAACAWQADMEVQCRGGYMAGGHEAWLKLLWFWFWRGGFSFFMTMNCTTICVSWRVLPLVKEPPVASSLPLAPPFPPVPPPPPHTFPGRPQCCRPLHRQGRPEPPHRPNTHSAHAPPSTPSTAAAATAAATHVVAAAGSC